MSQHEHHDPEAGFAGELGSALRATGESFALDGRPELVSGGLARGRRRLLRRAPARPRGAPARAPRRHGGGVAAPRGPP
ncbi:hypothetical protein ACFW1I_08920, partial [Streptomyces sp. NPDC058955]